MSESNVRIPSGLIEFQRRLLDFQRTVFTNAFETVVRAQDQGNELLQRWVERVPNLPEEGRTLVDTWVEAGERGRETFRSTVDRSFELLDEYYERLAEGQPTASGAR